MAVAFALALALVQAAVAAPSPTPAARKPQTTPETNGPFVVDPDRKFRCIKGDTPVGDRTWAECARLNGVKPEMLDVGVDVDGTFAAIPPAPDPTGGATSSQPHIP